MPWILPCLPPARRSFGFGGGGDAEVCERVETNPLAALARGGKARLERLGGNAEYAFYDLDTRKSYLTVIASRQTESGVPGAVAGGDCPAPRPGS